MRGEVPVLVVTLPVREIDTLLSFGGQSAGLLSDAGLGHNVGFGIDGLAGKVNGQHHIVSGGEASYSASGVTSFISSVIVMDQSTTFSVVFQFKLDLIFAGIVVQQ